MIRLVTSCAVAVFLSGCAQLTQLVSPSAGDVFVQPNAQATMRVTMPKLGAQGLAALSARNRGVATWRTADNTTFSFQDGVVVSTRGLGDDLMGADVSQSNSALRGGTSDWAPRLHGYMNGEFQPYFTVFHCRRTGSRSATVQVGSTLVFTNRTDETCVNDDLEFENSYWRNSNGVMVKSRQWVSEGIGYVETEWAVR